MADYYGGIRIQKADIFDTADLKYSGVPIAGPVIDTYVYNFQVFISTIRIEQSDIFDLSTLKKAILIPPPFNHHAMGLGDFAVKIDKDDIIDLAKLKYGVLIPMASMRFSQEYMSLRTAIMNWRTDYIS